jgi:CDP-diacylglycerol pyrophosphatase
MSPFRHTKLVILLVVTLVLIAIVSVAIVGYRQASKADALWKIVHGRCVPDMETKHNPAPCMSVDISQGEAGGFAILKDSSGNTQYLLIPTEKITGIESPAILMPDATNYFAKAWMETGLGDQRAGHTLPRTDFAIAINSESGRTQNQLHIHIDCIQPAVKSALEQVEPEIGTTWRTLPVHLEGHEYRAMWLTSEELEQRNPFRVLADSLPDPAQEMPGHTLVLAGAERNGQDGFILLDGKAPAIAAAVSPWIKLGYGSGEQLEDHACRIASGG